jgi:hypothetical protein
LDRRPSQADRGRTWGRTVDRSGPRRLRLGLASRRVGATAGAIGIGGNTGEPARPVNGIVGVRHVPKPE